MTQKVEDIIVVHMNSKMDYSLPILMDSNDIVVEHISSIPSFIQFSFPKYTFFPKRREDLGKYKVKGKLINSYGSLFFSFFV